MSKSEGKKRQVKAHNNRARFTHSLHHKQTLWLAGMLAFFVPAVAAGAWYAGGSSVSESSNESNSSSLNAEAKTEGSRATSEAGANARASARAGETSTTASAGNSSNPRVQTEVVINGKKVEVPNGGRATHTEVNNDGTTSSVSVSVNTQQNNSGSNYGSTNTHIHTNSSTHTNSNSNNNNSSTFFNSYSSSP